VVPTKESLKSDNRARAHVSLGLKHDAHLVTRDRTPEIVFDQAPFANFRTHESVWLRLKPVLCRSQPDTQGE
jgi:hypothetical protein